MFRPGLRMAEELVVYDIRDNIQVKPDGDLLRLWKNRLCFSEYLFNRNPGGKGAEEDSVHPFLQLRKMFPGNNTAEPSYSKHFPGRKKKKLKKNLRQDLPS